MAYSGSGWYRPDYRGVQLSAILPRISRAYALARWNTQTTVSFINVGLVKKGIATRYGYTRLDGEVRLQNVFAADFKGVVAWMPRDELVSDVRDFPRHVRRADRCHVPMHEAETSSRSPSRRENGRISLR